VKVQTIAGSILAGIPLLASGQGASNALQTVEQRQKELERRLQEQDARIQELERLLKESVPATAGSTAGVASAPAPSALPAPAATKPPIQRPTELSEPATYPAILAAATSPGPEYIGNLGFKIYESERAQIYMRLFSYARYLNQKGLDETYTDFFGNTKTVKQREDFQLNKFFLPFSGWFLDPKFRYYLYVWSAGRPTRRRAMRRRSSARAT
jgi:hypothetical protein